MTRKSTATAKYKFHEDTNTTSELLNLRVSFYWRPLANEELLKTFLGWNTPPYTSTPDFILMGKLTAG